MTHRNPMAVWRPTAEDQIHAAICQHLTIRPMPGTVWWHTPNGGNRSASEGARFKALGVKAGFPDLCALRNGRLFALELKREDGRVSTAQSAMLRALQFAGAETAVAFGLNEALPILDRWDLLAQNARMAE